MPTSILPFTFDDSRKHATNYYDTPTTDDLSPHLSFFTFIVRANVQTTTTRVQVKISQGTKKRRDRACATQDRAGLVVFYLFIDYSKTQNIFYFLSFLSPTSSPPLDYHSTPPFSLILPFNLYLLMTPQQVLVFYLLFLFYSSHL
ncbi:hypothetical protein BJ165DRAFT_156678 [Panaeolus papilionaceus]|nr:hypothetical protein BJ165DRAFT_156678 [Panaeolus papilionaceus]